MANEIRKILNNELIGIEDDVFTFKITTNSIDRYSDIVETTGAKLDKYLQNPIVLWGHNSNELAIGKCIEIIPQENELIAKAKFHELTETSKTVKALLAEGYLKATSIGFRPLKWYDEALTKEQIKNNPELSENLFIRHYTEWELLEFSIVNIPANPDCLIMNNYSYDNLKEKNITENITNKPKEIEMEINQIIEQITQLILEPLKAKLAELGFTKEQEEMFIAELTLSMTEILAEIAETVPAEEPAPEPEPETVEASYKEKAGKPISNANLSRLKSCADSLVSASKDLTDFIKEHEADKGMIKFPIKQQVKKIKLSDLTKK